MNSFDNLSPAAKRQATEFVNRLRADDLRQAEDRRSIIRSEAAALCAADKQARVAASTSETESDLSLRRLGDMSVELKKELARANRMFEHQDLVKQYASPEYVALDEHHRAELEALEALKAKDAKLTKELESVKQAVRKQRDNVDRASSALRSALSYKETDALREQCSQDLLVRAVSTVPSVPPPVYYFSDIKLIDGEVLDAIADSPCGCVCRFIDAHMEDQGTDCCDGMGWNSKIVTEPPTYRVASCPFHKKDNGHYNLFLDKLRAVPRFNMPPKVWANWQSPLLDVFVHR